MNTNKEIESRAHDEREMLASSLEDMAKLVRDPKLCRASIDQLASVADMVSRLASPSNIMTSYQVCRELRGISPKTLYNWVEDGLFPKPFQLPGAGNTHFWYSDDVSRAKKELIKKGVI